MAAAPLTDDVLSVVLGELQRLGALAEAGAVTPLGHTMLRMPVDPRVTKVVVEGARAGHWMEAVSLAAVIPFRSVCGTGRGPAAVGACTNGCMCTNPHRGTRCVGGGGLTSR